MTDVKEYIQYFKSIALTHPGIRDFYMMDINEPLTALRNDIQYPALILNSLSGKLRSPNGDNTIDVIQGGFMIIGHLENIDDFEGEVDILQETKRLGMDIIAAMIKDSRGKSRNSERFISGFSADSVTYEMLGPVFDNDYGFLFSFTVLISI